MTSLFLSVANVDLARWNVLLALCHSRVNKEGQELSACENFKSNNLRAERARNCEKCSLMRIFTMTVTDGLKALKMPELWEYLRFLMIKLRFII